MNPPSSVSARAVVRPADNGSVPINPGMGWMLFFYDNRLDAYGARLAPEDTLEDFPGFSVVYLRLAWCYIEPQPGRFDWSIIDGPCQRFIAAGKQVGFLFSCCEGHSNIIHAAPQWLQQAGARGAWFERGGVRYWEPTYDDPVFLKYLERFLAQVARRYDGDPNVAFYDIGSYGIWGEGHTFHSTKLPCTPEMVELHLSLHERLFTKTLLTLNDDLLVSGYGKDRPALLACARRWAAKGRFSLRDDSILVSPGKRAYKSADIAQPFWPVAPVVLESEHYGGSKARGNWLDGSKFEEAMEVYHASYVSIHWWPREFYQECRELVDRMNRRLGFRLLPLEVSWPERVQPGGTMEVAAKWANTGVAPCYAGGHPALTLKTPKGGIVLTFVDEGFNVRSLPVGPPGQPPAMQQRAAFGVPGNVAPGQYEVFLSVGSAIGTPAIALPLDGDDGQRRYRLGSTTVLPAGDVSAWYSGMTVQTS